MHSHPHHHPCNQLSRDVENGLRNKSPHSTKILRELVDRSGLLHDMAVASVTTSQLAHVASIPIQSGAQIVVPSTGGISIPASPPYYAVQLIVNIALADKLAVGNTLQWSSFYSTDGGATWIFYNGGNWVSYGPNGLTEHIPGDGTVTNPDPTLTVPLTPLAGHLARMTATFTGSITSVGVTVNGIGF